MFENIGNQLSLFLYLNKDANFIQKNISEESLKLGCTPIINLFEQTAEPIALNHAVTEYKIIPDANRHDTMEIYSVKKVSGLTADGKEINYSPFYSVSPRAQSQDESSFWHVSRKIKYAPELTRGVTSDLYLSFSDSEFKPAEKAVLKVEIQCTDGDLPMALSHINNEALFQIDLAAPIAKINCLLTFSKPLMPMLKNEAKWKLISSLSLNYLSLAKNNSNINSLKEILSLYDYTKSPEVSKLINGLLELNVRHITGRSLSDFHGALCKGIEINLTVDEDCFQSSGLYLFSAVLEAFFAEYASINSFTKLVISSKQTDGILYQWQPRSGNKLLL